MRKRLGSANDLSYFVGRDRCADRDSDSIDGDIAKDQFILRNERRLVVGQEMVRSKSK